MRIHLEKTAEREQRVSVESPRKEKPSESNERDARQWTKERLKRFEGMSDRDASRYCSKVFEHYDRMRSERGE